MGEITTDHDAKVIEAIESHFAEEFDKFINSK